MPLTGGILWQFMMPDRPDGGYRDVKSAVALHDGIMVVNSWDKTVYGVNVADGSLAWTYESPYALHSAARSGFFINPSPKVLDGVIYVGLGDARLHAINAENGAEIWTFPTNSAIVSSPAFWGELVYIASGRSGYDKTLYAVNKTTGSMAWSKTIATDGTSSPVVSGGPLSTVTLIAPTLSTPRPAWRTGITTSPRGRISKERRRSPRHGSTSAAGTGA